MIILEGMDNSGKSTLAAKFGLEVIHPGPPPKTWGEEQNCLNEQLKNARLPVVMDRVTCISSQVYKNRLFDKLYMDFLDRMLATPHCVLVYCRPPDEVVLNFDTHVVKAHDTKEHLQKVKDNAKRYLESYDKVMYNLPHLKYNYIRPNDDIIPMATDMVFHLKEWKKWIG